MSRQSKLSWGLLVLFVAAAVALNLGQANAEPSIHYANAPARLPAPITYETTRHTTTVTRTESPTNVTYRRAYAAPTCTTREVVYETPVVRYAEPVVYTRTYHAPRRVLRINTGPYYPPYRAYRHYGRGHRAYRPLYQPNRRHYPHHAYARGHRGHHYRQHDRPRGWGISVGQSRGYDGHRGGGFSFYLNR